MATFLELCRDAARESGTLAGGASLAAVEGATGRADKVVGWVRRAWLNIQNERIDWLWMRREFAGVTTIGQRRYTAAQLGIARFASFITDRPGFRPFTLWDPVRGQADETPVGQIEYDDWRTRYDRGTHDATRPTEYAVSPAGDLCLGATPDKAYPLRGEYRLAPQTLTESADVPEMPAQHHSLIVDEALRLMGNSDEATFLIQTSAAEYRAKRFALVRNQLPRVTVAGEALA